MSMAQQYLAGRQGQPSNMYDPKLIQQALGGSLPTSGDDVSTVMSLDQGNALWSSAFGDRPYDYRTTYPTGVGGTPAGVHLDANYRDVNSTGVHNENIDWGDRSTWGPITSYNMRYAPSLKDMTLRMQQSEAASNREAAIVQGLGMALTTAGLGGAFGGGSLAQGLGATKGGVLGTGLSTGMGVADAAIGGGLTNGAMTYMQGGKFGKGFGSGLIGGGLGYLGNTYVSPYLKGMNVPSWAIKPITSGLTGVASNVLQKRPLNLQNMFSNTAFNLAGSYTGQPLLAQTLAGLYRNRNFGGGRG